MKRSEWSTIKNFFYKDFKLQTFLQGFYRDCFKEATILLIWDPENLSAGVFLAVVSATEF